MHELALNAAALQACLFDSPADLHAAVNLARQEGFATRAEEVARCAAALRSAAGGAARNAAALDGSALAAEVASTCLQQAADADRALGHYAAAERLRDYGLPRARVARELAAAARTLRAAHRRLAQACRLVEADWRRTRYPRDRRAAAGDPSATCPHDHLLGRMVRSRHFLARLAGLLSRGAGAFRRGGPFPAGL